jgi:UDP-N-acetylglucosamine:LPS N-acetylglucosamine transferase
LSAAKALPDISFEVALGTLNAEYRAKFAPLENVVCHDFLSQAEMALAYERADLAITRAGATTMGELEAAGCPMLIIPLEGSANDHQKANAEAYAAKGEKVLFEKDLDRLSEELSKLMSRRARLDSSKSPSALMGLSGVVKTLCPR